MLISGRAGDLFSRPSGSKRFEVVEFIECQDVIRRQLRTLMRPEAFTPRVTGIVVLLFVVLTVFADRADAQGLRYVVRADPFEVQLTLPDGTTQTTQPRRE